MASVNTRRTAVEPANARQAFVVGEDAARLESERGLSLLAGYTLPEYSNYIKTVRIMRFKGHGPFLRKQPRADPLKPGCRFFIDSFTRLWETHRRRRGGNRVNLSARR